MKNLLLLLIVLICISSCKQFEITALRSGQRFSEKLPPLVPEFNKKSFGPHYPNIYDSAASILTGTLDPEAMLRNASLQDRIAYDTRAIFTHEVIENISERIGETKGVIVCRRGFRSRGITTPLNPLISLLTLTIPNWFGYAYEIRKDELELIVDIYDLNDKLIASFSGMGYGKARVALYKGYTAKNAQRKAHALAFKQALEDIKKQILEHRVEITAALND